jgi:hypothetical protein
VLEYKERIAAAGGDVRQLPGVRLGDERREHVERDELAHVAEVRAGAAPPRRRRTATRLSTTWS